MLLFVFTRSQLPFSSLFTLVFASLWILHFPSSFALLVTVHMTLVSSLSFPCLLWAFRFVGPIRFVFTLVLSLFTSCLCVHVRQGCYSCHERWEVSRTLVRLTRALNFFPWFLDSDQASASGSAMQSLILVCCDCVGMSLDHFSQARSQGSAGCKTCATSIYLLQAGFPRLSRNEWDLPGAVRKHVRQLEVSFASQCC